MIFVGNDDAGGHSWSIGSSGWTELWDVARGVQDVAYACYYRFADGTEAASETITGQNNKCYGWYLRISGVNQASPIDVEGGDQGRLLQTSETLATTITTTTNDTLVIAQLSLTGGDKVVSLGSSTDSSWSEYSFLNSGTGATDASGGLYIADQASSGTTATLGHVIDSGTIQGAIRTVAIAAGLDQTASVGRADSTEVARAATMTGAAVVANLGRADSTEVARAVTAGVTSPPQTASLGRADGTEVARAINVTPGGVVASLGRADGIEVARAINVTISAEPQTVNLGRADGIEVARPVMLTPGGVVASVGRADGTEVARGVVATVTAVLNLGRADTIEAARAINVTPGGVVLSLGRADSIGVARPVSLTFQALDLAVGFLTLDLGEMKETHFDIGPPSRTTALSVGSSMGFVGASAWGYFVRAGPFRNQTGSPIDLSGSDISVILTLTDPGGNTTTHTGSGTTDGYAKYRTGASDVDEAGVWSARFTVVKSGMFSLASRQRAFTASSTAVSGSSLGEVPVTAWGYIFRAGPLLDETGSVISLSGVDVTVTLTLTDPGGNTTTHTGSGTTDGYVVYRTDPNDVDEVGVWKVGFAIEKAGVFELTSRRRSFDVF